jgi:hypothetical protein
VSLISSFSGFADSKTLVSRWGLTQVSGQIVHPGCMSRENPQNVGNNKNTPRPFSDARFKEYLGHLGRAETVTLAAQAKARKAEVDVQKNLSPMQWFNVWAESALLMCVLSQDGNCAKIELKVVEEFFSLVCHIRDIISLTDVPKPRTSSLGGLRRRLT